MCLFPASSIRLIHLYYSFLLELRCPTGTGTDGREATGATWPWFSAMHCGRPSIEPLILTDSCDAETKNCAAVATDSSSSPPAVVSQTSVEEKEAATSALSGTRSLQEDRPSTSSCPPPAKKRRSRVLDFLVRESEKSRNGTHKLMANTTNSFLDLFEQLIKINVIWSPGVSFLF